MKQSAILRIVIYSVVILLLLALLLTGLGIGVFMVNFDSGNSDVSTIGSSGQVSADEIRDIEIEWAAGSITMVPGDTDQITFHEEGDIRENEQMVWRQSGDKLILQYSAKKKIWGIFLGSLNSTKDLTITVPRYWNCGELHIDAASADIDATEFTADIAELDTASGQCDFIDCHFGELDVDTASGEVFYRGSLNTLDCDAASASITAVLNNVPQRIDVDTASGDVDLTLPENADFSAELDTVSGSFVTDFNTTHQGARHISGTGTCQIDMDSASGDLTIRKAK